MLVASVGGLVVWPVSFGRYVGGYEGSYVEAASLFAVSTGQWLMVGYAVHNHFRLKVRKQ